jgi:hypothetical protein
MLERRHLGGHLGDRAQQQREHAVAPQLLLRMGYSQPAKPTPHRSADEVTFTGRQADSPMRRPFMSASLVGQQTPCAN